MLDGTTAEIKPREALRINPAKTCQPWASRAACPTATDPRAAARITAAI
jgi:hypothetical protein